VVRVKNLSFLVVPVMLVSCLRIRLKKSGHQGRVRISPSPYICGHFGNDMESMDEVDITVEYEPCASSTLTEVKVTAVRLFRYPHPPLYWEYLCMLFLRHDTSVGLTK